MCNVEWEIHFTLPHLLLTQTGKVAGSGLHLTVTAVWTWEVHKDMCESNFIKSPLWPSWAVSHAS